MARRRRHADCVAAHRPRAPTSATLRHLTLAALALPGLLPSAVQADAQSTMSLAWSRYEESHRRVHGINHQFAPLAADTFAAHGALSLAPGWRASLDYGQDTWAGATPVTSLPLAAMSPLSEAQLLAGASAKPSTGQVAPALVDAAMRPYVNTSEQLFQARYERDTRVIHMMTSASPETRKEGRGRLEYEWRDAALSAGGGVSDESDYHARFVDIAGRYDFDRKRSTVMLALSHALARSTVSLPSTWLGWVDTRIGEQAGIIKPGALYPDGTPRLEIDRQRREWGAELAVTRIATRSTVLEAGLAWRRGLGYLDSSYRVMSFLTRGASVKRTAVDGSALYGATLFHSYERRPARRTQWSADLKLVQDLSSLAAALHADYRYARDDWSVTAHTVELAWHQRVTPRLRAVPRVRYYAQSAAGFYRPYVDCGLTEGYACALSLGHYSSDYRLAAFGGVSAGLGASYRFVSGVTLDVDGEYYLHRGTLGLGSRPSARFADFAHYQLSTSLSVDFDTLAAHASRVQDTTVSHVPAHHHAMKHAMAGVPAGVTDAHMLDSAGQWMLGYRYQFASQAGALAHGRHRVSDADLVVHGGCDAPGCGVRPTAMRMHMHMLDVMFAPSEHWTLAVMPQFVDMSMTMTPLAGGPPVHHGAHDGHASGGVGDVLVNNLVRLVERPGQHLHAALGLSIPSGAAGRRLNPVAGHDHDPDIVRDAEYLHYGMQLGSGTWDVGAGLIYLGNAAAWSWGGRVALTSRLGQRNAAGYAWGDKFESSAWLGYQLMHNITLSLRGLATVQGRIKGRFDAHRVQDVASGEVALVANSIGGPMDSPANYGGRYYDLGIGLDVALPAAWAAGSTLGVEWLQPLAESVHGYQQRRDGALFVQWSVMF